ncbi:MAG TPA: aminotransferase class V-fold PLP-dependent enzyme [Streptosporangiaceae bacterium]|nr:aminotransferase class V-fold PLP-dependent enzyme [Streptosporangiaceae bacterium]
MGDASVLTGSPAPSGPAGTHATGPTSDVLPMVVGPTSLAPEVLGCLASQPPPLDDQGYMADVAAGLARLRDLVQAPSAASFIVPGTGTSGLESLAISLLEPGVPVLVASTGMWGDRWRDICIRNGIPAVSPAAGPGQPPDPDLMERLVEHHGCQAVLITHTDSSSGVRTDPAPLAAMAVRHGALSLVDGIAAAGSEVISQADWRVDAYLTGAPKALGAPAGVIGVTLSPRATETLLTRSWTPHGYSLDLRPWLPVMAATERGEFGYFQTPASALTLAFAEALRLALAEGRHARVERHVRLREALHAGLAGLGFRFLVQDGAVRSNGITVCWLPDTAEPAPFLRAVVRAGVQVQAGTHPAAASRTFRIGHHGNVSADDIDRTLAALRAAKAEVAVR